MVWYLVKYRDSFIVTLHLLHGVDYIRGTRKLNGDPIYRCPFQEEYNLNTLKYVYLSLEFKRTCQNLSQ
jgi:hypothetical protein